MFMSRPTYNKTHMLSPCLFNFHKHVKTGGKPQFVTKFQKNIFVVLLIDHIGMHIKDTTLQSP